MAHLTPLGAFPQKFGHYLVEAYLGPGGMDTVHRAHDRVLDIEVALKIPFPELLRNPVDRERFLHEARIGARLRHPNICRTVGYGTVDDTDYISMDFVD